MLLLFAAGAYFVDSNDPDSRMDAALDSILKQYGFVLVTDTRGFRRGSTFFPGSPPPPSTRTYDRFFRAPPFSRREADEIVAALRDVCKGCEFYQNPNSDYDKDLVDDVLIMGERFTVYEDIILCRDSSGAISSVGNTRKGTTLHVTKNIKSESLWQRITNWLPW